MNRQLNRPSPSQSATSFAVGTIMRGNDGRQWQITVNSNGVQRWVPAGGTAPPLPGIVYKFSIF